MVDAMSTVQLRVLTRGVNIGIHICTFINRMFSLLSYLTNIFKGNFVSSLRKHYCLNWLQIATSDADRFHPWDKTSWQFKPSHDIALQVIKMALLALITEAQVQLWRRYL